MNINSFPFHIRVMKCKQLNTAHYLHRLFTRETIAKCAHLDYIDVENVYASMIKKIALNIDVNVETVEKFFVTIPVRSSESEIYRILEEIKSGFDKSEREYTYIENPISIQRNEETNEVSISLATPKDDDVLDSEDGVEDVEPVIESEDESVESSETEHEEESSEEAVGDEYADQNEEEENTQSEYEGEPVTTSPMPIPANSYNNNYGSRNGKNHKNKNRR